MRLLPLLALLGGACAGAHGVRDWSGAQSEIPATLQLVAQDRTDWVRIWERVGEAPPKADLDKDFGVALFLGDKGPGEYRFAWSYRTENDRRRIVVGYKVYHSARDAGARTRPWAVFLFPRDIARPGAEVLVEDQTPGGAASQ